jgi:6-phosphogluconolactonase
LTLIGIEPSGAEQPQNLAITPDGRLLLCANMAGNRVVVLRIDPQTGHISPTGQEASMPRPSCIMVR